MILPQANVKGIRIEPNGAPMTQSLAETAIALLIELAERGEIDPWDVQVIDVIDRFLRDLNTQSMPSTGRTTYEVSLSESGQAFLYASMLVLLKADSLARAETPVETPEELADTLLETEMRNLARLPLNLERRLRRRTIAPPPPQRRVTLQELIDQLRLMEQQMEQHQPKSRTRRPRPPAQGKAIRAIAQLAHQENLSETVLELEQFLVHQWPHLTQGQDCLEFEELVQLWARAKYHQGLSGSAPLPVNAHDRVGIFWALLLLSAQSKVELSQDEFYQEIKVRSLVDWQTCAVPE